MAAMESTKYIYWQDNNLWLGYLQDYPDYWTQGESLEAGSTIGFKTQLRRSLSRFHGTTRLMNIWPNGF